MFILLFIFLGYISLFYPCLLGGKMSGVGGEPPAESLFLDKKFLNHYLKIYNTHSETMLIFQAMLFYKRDAFC
jgi:hypothetical protein